MQKLVELVESFVEKVTADSTAAHAPDTTTLETAATQLEAELLRVREAGHALFIGTEAVEAYETFLATVRGERAAGKAYIAIMYGGDLELQVRDEDRLDDLHPNRLDRNIQFVLIDRSNRQGDSWKATFYPHEAVTTFVKRT
jgi:hypothetical protein